MPCSSTQFDIKQPWFPDPTQNLLTRATSELLTIVNICSYRGVGIYGFETTTFHCPIQSYRSVYIFSLLYYHIYCRIDPNLDGRSGLAAGSLIFTPIISCFFSVCMWGKKQPCQQDQYKTAIFFYHRIKVIHTHTTPPVCGHFEHCKHKNHILFQLNLFNVLYWHKNTQWTDACTAGLKF